MTYLYESTASLSEAYNIAGKLKVEGKKPTIIQVNGVYEIWVNEQ